MTGELAETSRIGAEKRLHHPDKVIAALANAQHGVVATFQLAARGISWKALEGRRRRGRLHRIHRGVYAVGHRVLSPQGWRMAAVLSGGPGTVLSHRAAGSELGLRAWTGRPAITTPSPRRPNRRIEFHSSALPPDERTVLDGIPITTVARTLLDLATILDSDALLGAVNVAENRQLSDRLSLPALLDRHRGERGTAALREALESARFGKGVAVEALEELFARFVRRCELPPPELNAPIHVGDRFYVADCLWREQRLIVELQSVKHHGTASALTRDAARTRQLTLAGWRVVSVTWAQLSNQAKANGLARDLKRLLAC